ncbi:MAG: hypothetical protein ABI305_07385 [Tepidiformaceae bacterium]
MNPKLAFALYVVSFIFLCLAAFNVESHPRFQWLGAGLATFVLVFLITAYEAI